MVVAEAPSPGRPQIAVSATIFRNNAILLVRRARPPARGFYTLPGGRVEYGETLIEAVRREVHEETSLKIDVVGFSGWREIIPDPGRGTMGHFVILSFAAHWAGGDVVLNDELDDARWVDPEDFGDLKTTEGLPDIVRNARALVED